uniref:dephospho-CoA kinase domain-containing protein isoform X2 n=1 Tax=Doryrhamphus excisus TaxID=161450 RepID=UPI0025AE8D1B|nr:dephospho-CoA kinase domain-containing protein isoform X2 [Doryrhamphus excisus]XP_057918561.1 dephospho-CoA kinase domain-containing protein isoform X2 [Doryrhamphus excisus]
MLMLWRGKSWSRTQPPTRASFSTSGPRSCWRVARSTGRSSGVSSLLTRGRGSCSTLSPTQRSIKRCSNRFCFTSSEFVPMFRCLGYRYVVLDVPLLFETRKLTQFLNHTVVVYCDPPTQLSRLMQRDGLTQEEAEQRLAAQMPLNEKRGLASHVVENSGTREDTHRQVLRLHTKLEDSMDFLLVRVLAVAATAGLGGILLYTAKLLLS